MLPMFYLCHQTMYTGDNVTAYISSTAFRCKLTSMFYATVGKQMSRNYFYDWRSIWPTWQ